MVNEKRRDLIDRQALGIGRCNPDAFPLQNRGYVAGWNGVISLLEQAPTVDAVEVVHARWVYNGRSDEYFCSNCYKQPISFRREMNCGVGEFVEVCFSDFCPNCGASMRDGDGNG